MGEEGRGAKDKSGIYFEVESFQKKKGRYGVGRSKGNHENFFLSLIPFEALRFPPESIGNISGYIPQVSSSRIGTGYVESWPRSPVQ
jgi:hypothetical protein